MPDITLNLLGDINHKSRKSDIDYTLAPKYMVVVKAWELANLFRYKRSGKQYPFKIEPSSLICLDEEVQRGINDHGNLLQEQKKVDEIRDLLLGREKESSNAYLGTLVWNVRDQGEEVFETVKHEVVGKQPKYKLTINTSRIYLTDSAHRHLGICEAFNEYSKDPGKYPRFDKDFEFTVEIYNLSRNLERTLFTELNSKQKKITKAKATQIDNVSPLGQIKDRIITLDQESEKLFSQNIEVNSNQNDRHTLMTMSVFTSTIQEMFGREVNDSVDDDKKDELAQYYLDFFYKLRDLKVKVKIRNSEEEINPFNNLYNQVIRPAEDSVANLDEEEAENELLIAREKARKINQEIREQDKLNSNSFVKALSYIGGRIRYIETWSDIIDNIQTSMIAAYDGRYFQKGNDKLTVPRKTGHPIATIKDDGTLNVQVQSHIIKEIKNLFEEELELIFTPTCQVVDENGDKQELSSEITSADRVTLLSHKESTKLDILFFFEVGSLVQFSKSDIKMRVQVEIAGERWSECERTGAKRLSCVNLSKFAGYEHRLYGQGIHQYEARFELDIPPYSKEYMGVFQVRLTIDYPDISGSTISERFYLNCQGR